MAPRSGTRGPDQVPDRSPAEVVLDALRIDPAYRRHADRHEP